MQLSTRSRKEDAFCVFALLILAGAFTTLLPRMQGIELVDGEANPYSTAANAGILAGLMLLVALSWSKVVFVCRHGGVMNLLALLCLLSILWSQAPDVSARRIMLLLTAIVFAYYLLARYSVEHFIQLSAVALGIAMVSSAAVAIALPSVGVMNETELAGSWCGVFGHKTQLGGATVLAVLCFGWLVRHGERHRILNVSLLLLSLFLAIMARSRIAQVTIVLICSFAVFMPLLRVPGLMKVWAAYGMVVTALSFGAILYFFFDEIVGALGKDATLTGRVPAWQSLLAMAAERPFGGHGLNAFFVPGNPDLEGIWRKSGWVMWGAHNNFIQMMLDLGVPGLVLAVWALVEMIWRALNAWIAGTVSWASFAVLFGITCPAINMLEDVMFRNGNMQLVVFVVLFVAQRIHRAAALADAQLASVRPGRKIHPNYAAYHSAER